MALRTAGCGKTVLASRTLEDLIDVSESDPKKPIIYFYFKGDDIFKSDPIKMLRGLVKQLFQKSNWKSDPLRLLYERQNPESPLSGDRLLTTLCDMASKFDEVYLVLDALDECEDRGDLYEFLEAIGQWQKVNSPILLTSREEQDIKEAIESMNIEKSYTRLTAELLRDDIHTYVSSRLETDIAFKRWKRHPEVRKEIENSLTEKSDKM